jgi:hypothetical protein
LMPRSRPQYFFCLSPPLRPISSSLVFFGLDFVSNAHYVNAGGNC